ncbi:MAG: family 43 glycosylhydrolase [Lachnospiraceae bacterium]|nr:family 43 glycosylhydrolase [Lachnospiraceae bacterium]
MFQKFSNPIIPGFNPDPSICRVGDTYYLVTSSFEYFPGVAIYRSRNLAEWELINHCLTRKSQLNLTNSRTSGGIYAPTLRYHEGIFYMITTNVDDRGNFLVYTDDITGEWSEPVWLSRGGIDPSLLFADGKVYFVSNQDSRGNQGIYLNEINPQTGENLSEEVLISKGCIGRFPEGPHLYKIDGTYYLLLAEGGTEYGHMVTIQRSSRPYGPYESCSANPVLSHRYKEDMSIMCTGHGDLVEDTNGRWWMTVLGVRTLSGEGYMSMLHNLGRETFLAPVTWENGWPVVGKNGTIDLVMEADLPAREKAAVFTGSYLIDTDFRPGSFSKQYLFLRNPEKDHYRFDESEQCLILSGGKAGLSDRTGSPTFLAVRQTEFAVDSKVTIRFPDQETRKLPDCTAAEARENVQNEELRCGITAFYNNEHHYDLCFVRKEGVSFVELRKQIYDLNAAVSRIAVPDGAITLEIRSDQEYYYFYASAGTEKPELIGKGAAAALCTEVTRRMSFTGTLIGIFCEQGTARIQDFVVRAKRPYK